MNYCRSFCNNPQMNFFKNCRMMFFLKENFGRTLIDKTGEIKIVKKNGIVLIDFLEQITKKFIKPSIKKTLEDFLVDLLVELIEKLMEEIPELKLKISL